MGLEKIFTVGFGLMGAFAGAAGSLIMDLPAVAAPVAAVAAGLGAAGTSAVTNGIVSSIFNGKGPEAGVSGMFWMGAGHLVAVPIASLWAAKLALKATGFIP